MLIPIKRCANRGTKVLNSTSEVKTKKVKVNLCLKLRKYLAMLILIKTNVDMGMKVLN